MRTVEQLVQLSKLQILLYLSDQSFRIYIIFIIYTSSAYKNRKILHLIINFVKIDTMLLLL